MVYQGFLQPNQNHPLLIRLSGMGLIIYKEGVESFNYYRDSLKMREYAACGLPIISDKSTGTSEEAEKYGACLRIENSAEEIAKAIRFLLENDQAYRKFSQNALKWARAFDKRLLLKKIID